MSESVATLGAGKLLVFQPATGADEIALPVALGIQRFWSRRLKEAGRPSMYFVMVGKIERLVDAQGVDATSEDVAVGDKFVLPLGHLADDAEPARLIQAHGGRWGLVSAFGLTGPRFHLESRLLEVQDGAVRVLERHALDDDNIDLPRHIFEILTSTAQRTGARAPWHHWSDPFGSGDEVAALHYLKAEGACSMVEEGVRMRVADAFEPVVQALGQSPRMPLALEVARTLTRVLGEKDVASLALARELRRLRELGVNV